MDAPDELLVLLGSSTFCFTPPSQSMRRTIPIKVTLSTIFEYLNDKRESGSERWALERLL